LKKQEEEFLGKYMESLRLCLGLKPSVKFHRYILVNNEEEFATSLNSHRPEYIEKLHRDINGEGFGFPLFTLIFAEKWPEILNDAVFFGSCFDGAKPQWDWAVCSTYSPGHPTILLRMFDLSNEQGKECLVKELSALGFDELNKFTDWVFTNRKTMPDA
jgi:hypothetical protein